MKIKTTKQALNKAMELLGEALYLVDAYSGGESENGKELEQQFEKLELAIFKLEEQQ